MKKEERLNRLFGDIDDDLVAGAASRPIPLKVWLPRVTAAVAAVALTVGLVLTEPWMTEKPPLKDTVITTTPQSATSQTTTTNADKNVPVEDPTEDGLKQPETELGTEPGIHTTTTVVNNISTTQKTTTVKPTTQKTTTAHTVTSSSSANITADAPVENPPQTELGNEPTHHLTTQFTTNKPTAIASSTGGTPTSTAPTNNEIWYEPHWEDKPIWQQFSHFERFNIGSYTVHDITINNDKGMVEEYLEDVNLHGYDIYTDTSYEIVGKAYRIKGINPACAVALQYPGRTDFFPAVCSKYSPATLGEFITDLNLREHLRVGTVYHSYRDADGTYHDKEYDGLTVEKVWEMLLSDTTLPNVAGQPIDWKNKISIRIDMPLLGYHNISISLSENGYLRTNLLDTEKIFFIGEDTVDAFMAYVEENCRLQKDDELIPMPDDTNADTGATMTSSAQLPLVTGTTAWEKPPAD